MESAGMRAWKVVNGPGTSKLGNGLFLASMPGYVKLEDDPSKLIFSLEMIKPKGPHTATICCDLIGCNRLNGAATMFDLRFALRSFKCNSPIANYFSFKDAPRLELGGYDLQGKGQEILLPSNLGPHPKLWEPFAVAFIFGLITKYAIVIGDSEDGNIKIIYPSDFFPGKRCPVHVVSPWDLNYVRLVEMRNVVHDWEKSYSNKCGLIITKTGYSFTEEWAKALKALSGVSV